MKNKNLIKILTLFNNKPRMLAKYLIDNMALKDEFIRGLENNKKLTDIKVDDKDFNSIDEMNIFYQSLYNTDAESIDDLLNRLEDLIKKENYEEAIILRDYIKRKKKNK
jgi:hypothetical protein